MKKRNGFTLLELLVVLTVVALICAVLFPVFASARARAANTACLSNLRQLHLAVVHYASDSDGLLPPYGTDFGSGFGDTDPKMEEMHVDYARELTTVLQPYIKEPAVWFCPNDTFAHTDSKDGFVNHLYTSYKTSQNWFAIGDKPLPVLGHTLLDHPNLGKWQGRGELGLFTDDLWGCVDVAWQRGDRPPSYSHGNRYNIVMFDGHIVSFSYDKAPCYGYN